MQLHHLLALLAAGLGGGSSASVDRTGQRSAGKPLPRFVDVDNGSGQPWLGPPKWSLRLKLRRRRARAAR